MEEVIIIDTKKREIKLEADEEFNCVAAYFEDRKIGSFSFHIRDSGAGEYLLVTNMHLEEISGFKHCGIGTAIVDWVEERTEYNVEFGRNDGEISEDGSHLTGDGPGFAAHIRKRRTS